jgi:outer membrane protein assembly factor BamD (BamD/ComL family)
MKKLAQLLAFGVAITVTFVSFSARAAAPAGWELRNGAWVPLVEPGAGTPEGQVAQMIKDLREGNTGTVIDDAKDWIKKNQTHPLMPQVLLLQGDAEVLRGNKYAALYPYEDLLNNYPTSDLFLPTLEREYNLADAFLNGYKRKFLGLRILPVTDDAIELLDRIQDRQRGSAIAERAGLRVADYYFNQGKFQDAIDGYSDFLKRYPYSQYVRKAEIRRAEASLGNFRGVLFDFTPLYDARERLATIAVAYPQSAEVLQVKAVDDRIYQLEGEKDLEIARYYYRAGKKYASAYYYRRVIANWPDTTYAETAHKELAARVPGGAAK